MGIPHFLTHQNTNCGPWYTSTHFCWFNLHYWFIPWSRSRHFPICVQLHSHSVSPQQNPSKISIKSLVRVECVDMTWYDHSILMSRVVWAWADVFLQPSRGVLRCHSCFRLGNWPQLSFNIVQPNQLGSIHKSQLTHQPGYFLKTALLKKGSLSENFRDSQILFELFKLFPMKLVISPMFK
jgi:hypothetical protein